ncbi:50S ribosomal protein L18 [Longimicrobium terrae]|uniref:Large ribosomal subunit protein uL18 n=1 Tax=Longimicrobium terrae TaxID=1639882 RepID=A0A841GUB8_9BACT|nr:50S ribosomal protein L18 [Longimicrobium terrae]MBB4634466.1 large subunit ribosomal protein L18 [Longimicrobium terrae]MBB6068644.1 large subunit ribosomal protein L18 [Longimicrobium terrae]NNC27830.1 50S ribosomal protein L18 [Longimicrobium terrae]
MAGTRRVKTREERRARRHRRVRGKVHGTSERPRLVIHRSINHVEAQVVDDIAGRTLVGLSTLDSELRARRAELTKTEASHAAGKALAQKARDMGVTQVVFDRGGYVYHGRVKAFAEGAREGGLEF